MNSNSKALALSLTFVLLLPLLAWGQCGDFDDNGVLNAGDAAGMMQYFFTGGAAPVDYDHSDFDLHQQLTFNDLAEVWACLLICDFTESLCPPTETAIDPAVDSSFVIKYPETVPVGFSHFAIYLMADAFIESQAICLPLRIRVDGQVPQIDSIVTPTFSSYADTSGNAKIRFSGVISADSGIAVVAGAKVYANSFRRPDFVAKIYVTVPTQAFDQTIDIQFVELTPAQAVTGQENTIFAMYAPPDIVSTATLPLEPLLQPLCCAVAGDANGDSKVSIGDAVFLINCLFISCHGSCPCPEECDPDANGQPSIGDAVYLINYIFGGGPAPQCGTGGPWP